MSEECCCSVDPLHEELPSSQSNDAVGDNVEEASSSPPPPQTISTIEEDSSMMGEKEQSVIIIEGVDYQEEEEEEQQQSEQSTEPIENDTREIEFLENNTKITQLKEEFNWNGQKSTNHQQVNGEYYEQNEAIIVKKGDEEESDQELKSINELKRKINQSQELILEHANQMERALKKRRERDALLTSPIPHSQEIIKYFEIYKSQTLVNWLEDDSLELDTLADHHLYIFGGINAIFSEMMNEVSKNQVFNYVKSISSIAESRVNEILFMYIPKMIEDFQNKHEVAMEAYLTQRGKNFWFRSNQERVKFFKQFLLMKLVAKPMHFDIELPKVLQVDKIDQNVHLQYSLELKSGTIDKVLLPRLVFDEDGSTALEGLYLVK